MGGIRKSTNGEFDYSSLPEGVYFFTGEEGFVKVDVDNNGNQSWDLANWFDSLDPERDEDQRNKIIKDIKQRLNAETGMIKPTKRKTKKNFLTYLLNKQT